MADQFLQTESALKRDAWVVTHRALLQRTAASVAWVFDFLLIGGAVWLAVSYVTHISQDREIQRELSTPGVVYANVQRPQPIQTLRATALRDTTTSTNVMVQLRNPNTNWAAEEVKYTLVVGAKTIQTSSISLAPGQETVEVVLHEPLSGEDLPAPRVTFESITWKRIHATELPQAKWQFTQSELALVTPGGLDPSGTAAAAGVQTELSVTMKNQSVYGFREPDIVAVLTDGAGTPIAVDKITLDKIRSQEVRQLTFRFPGRQTALQPVVYVNVDTVRSSNVITSLE